jgi:adenylate cyclase
MAEVMAPEDVLALLREFHTRMTAQIFASGGTVDQYMGDGIIAVFGAPVASPNDAANALNCAEMMLDALEHWNDERERKGEAQLDIGISLNYGQVVLGVAAKAPVAFTATRDTVSTAARLQVLTRSLKTPLVVTDAVVQAVRIGPGDRRRATPRIEIGVNIPCASERARCEFDTQGQTDHEPAPFEPAS